MSVAALPEILDTAVSQPGTRATFAAHDTPSVSIDEVRRDILKSLYEVFRETSTSGWDGYDADPVSFATLTQALAFIDLLPSTLPRPEISAHPDGELAFEWALGRRRLLSVSVNESGRLSYAALFGAARIYGTEFLLDSLPEPITRAFQRLYSGA
jgi:hypothetical protein